jgi:benzil reductase ((S)-benzoin forming)
MSRIIVITGATSGLGYEIASQALTDPSIKMVLSVSRSSVQARLENFKENYKELIVDLADLDAVSSILVELNDTLKNYEEIIFISNAGSISPITSIGEYSVDEIRDSSFINAIAPAIIINNIVGNCLSQVLRLVNISSGAADNSIAGWGLYCSSKSYMKMYFKVLESQAQPNNRINIIQIDPGVLDTNMQRTIRNADESSFPRLKDFKMLSETGKLASTKDAAKKVLAQILSN